MVMTFAILAAGSSENVVGTVIMVALIVAWVIFGHEPRDKRDKK